MLPIALPPENASSAMSSICSVLPKRFAIQPAHANKLARQLATLHMAQVPAEMDMLGWRLHALSGDMAGHWSVWVSANWRLTFRFDGGDAEIVNYQDYH